MARSGKMAIAMDEAKKSILLLPAIVLLIAFFMIPIVLTVYYSFTNLALSGSNAANFKIVGLENYIKMLTDPNTLIAIKNTLIFLVGSLIGQSVLGFAIAYLMKSKAGAFRSLLGLCILAGWVMPEIVVALCCSSFFQDSGTLNMIMGSMRIAPIAWLYQHPMAAVVAANIWHGTAFSMMNFQSALDNVSGDIEEAAKVDGANRRQTLLRIIIPSTKDTIATNTMLNTLSTLGVFGLIYIMTGGGPGNSTSTLPIYMYRQAFTSGQMGAGTAIGMLILAVGIVCSIIYARIMKSDN